MKIIIQNATITVYMTPETSEEEVIETAKKKKGHYIPVNSPESFAICRRIAAEERERRGKMVNPISGKVVDRKPRKQRAKITPSIEERVREMTKEGLSIRTQATALGISPASVQKIRQRQKREE